MYKILIILRTIHSKGKVYSRCINISKGKSKKDKDNLEEDIMHYFLSKSLFLDSVPYLKCYRWDWDEDEFSSIKKDQPMYFFKVLF